MSAIINDQRLNRLIESGNPSPGAPADIVKDHDRVAAIKAELQAAGVEYCYASYVDIHGRPKAKCTPIEKFEKMCAGSELFTVGAMEGMGLSGPQEDECAAVPDLDTGVVLPWDRTRAWFTGHLYYHGEPYPNDSRVILQRMVERAEARGIRVARWRISPGHRSSLPMAAITGRPCYVCPPIAIALKTARQTWAAIPIWRPPCISRRGWKALTRISTPGNHSTTTPTTSGRCPFPGRGKRYSPVPFYTLLRRLMQTRWWMMYSVNSSPFTSARSWASGKVNSIESAMTIDIEPSGPFNRPKDFQ